MTKLLEKAIKAVSKLPEERQEAIAALMLAEAAAEARYGAQFVVVQDIIGRLADAALQEYRDGKTRLFEKDSDLAHN